VKASLISRFGSQERIESNKQKQIDDLTQTWETIGDMLKNVNKHGKKYAKTSAGNIEDERQFGDVLVDMGRLFKSASEDRASRLGEELTKVGEFQRAATDLRSDWDTVLQKSILTSTGNFMLDVERAKDCTKEHDKTMNNYVSARSRTRKEKDSKKANPFKITELETEEATHKRTFEDSEETTLKMLEELLTKNSEAMVLSICTTYIEGLNKYFSNGLDKIEELSNQLNGTPQPVTPRKKKTSQKKKRKNLKKLKKTKTKTKQILALFLPLLVPLPLLPLLPLLPRPHPPMLAHLSRRPERALAPQ
jgi:hypothetical protein